MLLSLLLLTQLAIPVEPDQGKSTDLAQVNVSIRPTDQNITFQPQGPRVMVLDNHQCELPHVSTLDQTGMKLVLKFDPESSIKRCPAETSESSATPAGDSKFQVVIKYRGFKKSSSRWFSLERGKTEQIDMMLMPKSVQADLTTSSWSELKEEYPLFSNLLLAGAHSEPEAAAQYASLSKNKPAAVAAFFNITTALSEFRNQDGNCLLKQYKRIIWEQRLRPDRFFAYADIKLIEIARKEKMAGRFHSVTMPWLLHPGGTLSYRQTTQSRANFQLTFHMRKRKIIDGIECVMVETDIDYYPNPFEHFFSEVLVNRLFWRLTDPAKVFYLRGIEAQHAGNPPVDTPYGWAARH
jgi:hypothetical protein